MVILWKYKFDLTEQKQSLGCIWKFGFFSHFLAVYIFNNVLCEFEVIPVKNGSRIIYCVQNTTFEKMTPKVLDGLAI